MSLLMGRRSRAVARHPQQKPRHGTRLNFEQVSRFGGLLGFWAMTEGSGTVVRDLSPNRNDATFTAANLSWSAGKTGSTLFSNSGVTSSAGALIVNNFTFTGKFTIEALVAPDLITGVYRTISRTSSGAGNGPGLYLGDLNKFAFFDAGTNTSLYSTTTPVARQFYHVLVTYDGVTKKIYVNGKLEGSQAATFSGGTGTLQSFTDNFNANFNGRIEYVRWWDRPLTAEQIAELAEAPYQMFEPLAGSALMVTTAPVPVLPPMPLPGSTLTGSTTKKRYYQRPVTLASTVNPQTCWEPLTQRLLGYLGKPFRKASDGLLWSFMSTIARELTACVSTVAVTAGAARGGGTFTFPVTFDPIARVTGVRRVSSLGALLESYSVVSWDGRNVTVSGVTPPSAGDYLQVDYSYTHDGLHGRINTALMELNILTATGSFLDAWGTWFGMVRVKTGKYSSTCYGPGTKYGTGGVELDNSFANRIIDRITQGRNTPVAIVAAVKRLTGGNPYIVSWMDGGGNNSFIFRPTGSPAWTGQSDTRKHLIWGRTARFVKGSTSNGGAFVFEVWVPSGTGYSKTTLLNVVNQYKPAGSKAFIRYYS